MTDTVISVENLSKKYVIGHQNQEGYTTLSDKITSSFKSITNVFNPKQFKKDTTQEDFWALKDVSFEIKQGDRVGIIGRNGAGKSTLLKILSRITEPTSGKISIKGRVASLLEVGTGFHPELTGRENVFLNGAILGMDRVEIKKKFDEIVAFAEVEKFLDTPVKRYSSGMYVRLAFAVAAHLEPEILIVDEVLAVGDAAFQKKCLGKMEDVGKEGRTVLFVSHNMSTIQSLCSRCIMLQAGQILVDRESSFVIQKYLQNSPTDNSFVRPPQKDGKPTIVSGKIISSAEFENEKIQIDIQVSTEIAGNVAISLRLCDGMGHSFGYGEIGESRPDQLIKLNSGLNLIKFTLPINHLALGQYYFSLDISIPWVEFYDRVENCLFFEVVRPVKNNATHVLSQSWGFGSVEFPLSLV